MSTKKTDASLAAPPSPGTDPLKCPSPVNEHLISSLRKVLTDEKRVLASFIPSDEPDHPTLKMFVLRQDKELKTQYQGMPTSRMKLTMPTSK
jgi:hypothetical protein